MRGRQTLGKRIRQLRKSAGMTQQALASAADIGRVTLVRIESGEQTPKYKTLSAIAQVLKKTIGEILVGEEWLT